MGSSYLGEDEGGEYCETCYGRPGDVSKKTHERELASLRAEVERLRGAASVDVEARRLVDALTANGEHEFLIDEERVESLPDEQHNEIVYALRALRTALGAQG